VSDLRITKTFCSKTVWTLALVLWSGGRSDSLLPLVSKTRTHLSEVNTSLLLGLEMTMLIMAMAGGSSNLLLPALPQQSFQAPSLKELTFLTICCTLPS